MPCLHSQFIALQKGAHLRHDAGRDILLGQNAKLGLPRQNGLIDVGEAALSHRLIAGKEGQTSLMPKRPRLALISDLHLILPTGLWGSLAASWLVRGTSQRRR